MTGPTGRAARAARPAGTVSARTAALFATALLAVAWAVWAWRNGGYFPTVMLPGTLALCACVALLARYAPYRMELGLSPPARLALAALVGLGCWYALSALWSPAPDVAIEDGQRVLGYALAFAIGAWACNLLGAQMRLSWLPLAAGGAFAALVATAVLVAGDDPRHYLEQDGTLEYPLGYRNANAAFFAIALFPALAVATQRDLDWRVRIAGLGVSTACLDLFLFSQSRGSVPAIFVGVVVYVMLSPLRLRALAWLALALLPALGVLPALQSLYDAAQDEGVRRLATEMHTAGGVVVATTIVSVLLGVFVIPRETRLPGLGAVNADANRPVARGLAAVTGVAVVAFLVAVGNPVDWIGKRVEEFGAGTPNLSGEKSRFVVNAGSNRDDLWRVALEEAGGDPLFGTGGGGYGYAYLRERDSATQNAQDAHSIELEVLAELGLPGLALLVAAIGGATAGALRARRLGPGAGTLTAVALASGSYWLVHASVDWFWPYPAVTAPVIALAGAACAPAMLSHGGGGDWRIDPWRRRLAAVAAILALSTLPPYLSERYVNQAYDGWTADLEQAYDDLGRARTLNPLSEMPWLAEGVIARATGDRERAIEAFGEVARGRPEEWVAPYLLADLHVDRDPEFARAEIEVALALNPLSGQVRRLAERLGASPPPGG